MKLFEIIGYKITIDRKDDIKDLVQNKKFLRQIKKFDKDTFISVVQQVEYDNLNYHFLRKSEQDLIASEQLKLEAMTLLQFYNLASIEAKSDAQKLVGFDDKAKSRPALKNLSIARKQFDEVQEPKKAILSQIFNKIFSILNININTLCGEYNVKDIDKLVDYIRTEKIIFKSEVYIVRKELTKLGCSINIKKEYTGKDECRGTLSSNLLRILFKLKQKSKRASTGQRSIESYYLCTEQNDSINYYYNLRYC